MADADPYVIDHLAEPPTDGVHWLPEGLRRYLP
jgi:hypothetical protein